MVDGDGRILEVEVVPRAVVADALRRLVTLHDPARIVLGDGTAHEELLALVGETLGDAFPVDVVDERNSTLEARELYFRENPPAGWRRLVPRFLLLPEEMDGWAAAVLALRAAG